MADLSKLQHSSLHNYQQILQDGNDTFSGSKIIIHDLGAVPYARVWNEQVAGEVSLPVVASASTAYHDDYATTAQIDSLSLTANRLEVVTSANLKVYWRIYLDVSG